MAVGIGGAIFLYAAGGLTSIQGMTRYPVLFLLASAAATTRSRSLETLAPCASPTFTFMKDASERVSEVAPRHAACRRQVANHLTFDRGGGRTGGHHLRSKIRQTRSWPDRFRHRLIPLVFPSFQLPQVGGGHRRRRVVEELLQAATQRPDNLWLSEMGGILRELKARPLYRKGGRHGVSLSRE